MKGVEDSWNTHDMQAFAKLLREDAEWVNVVGMHWRGRDAVVKAHAIFHEIMFKDCKLKTDEIESRALGDDHAIAVVTSTQDAYTTPDGHVMPKGQTRLSLVLARSADGWKIVHAENVRINAEAVMNDPVNGPPK
ncbi:MAG: SgcJ/EcaC family oxidoreductase [Verrucomicrobiota bacterium]